MKRKETFAVEGRLIVNEWVKMVGYLKSQSLFFSKIPNDRPVTIQFNVRVLELVRKVERKGDDYILVVAKYLRKSLPNPLSKDPTFLSFLNSHQSPYASKQAINSIELAVLLITSVITIQQFYFSCSEVCKDNGIIENNSNCNSYIKCTFDKSSSLHQVNLFQSNYCVHCDY